MIADWPKHKQGAFPAAKNGDLRYVIACFFDIKTTAHNLSLSINDNHTLK